MIKILNYKNVCDIKDICEIFERYNLTKKILVMQSSSPIIVPPTIVLVYSCVGQAWGFPVSATYIYPSLRFITLISLIYQYHKSKMIDDGIGRGVLLVICIAIPDYQFMLGCFGTQTQQL